MSVVAGSIAQSLAQVAGADRGIARIPDKREPNRTRSLRRDDDQFESVIDEAKRAQRVRDLAGNDQEQAHEDHQEHAPAPSRERKPSAAPSPDAPPPTQPIDIVA